MFRVKSFHQPRLSTFLCLSSCHFWVQILPMRNKNRINLMYKIRVFIAIDYWKLTESRKSVQSSYTAYLTKINFMIIIEIIIPYHTRIHETKSCSWLHNLFLLSCLLRDSHKLKYQLFPTYFSFFSELQQFFFEQFEPTLHLPTHSHQEH